MNATSMSATSYHFFLGGADAEMRRIAEVLKEAGVRFSDAGLGWGARVSAYGTAVAEAAEAGFTPVLVELEIDTTVPPSTVVVDHHGERAGEAPALIQVLHLIGQKPTRHDLVIAAHDAAFLWGLRAIGASLDEVAGALIGETANGRSATEIMALARNRWLNPDLKSECQRALVAPEEWVGRFRIIRLAHSKCAGITEPLAETWGDLGEHLIVLSEDGETNIFGWGEGNLVHALTEKFGGWSGGVGLYDPTPEAIAFWNGSPPKNTFWGGYPPHDEVVEFLRGLTE